MKKFSPSQILLFALTGIALFGSVTADNAQASRYPNRSVRQMMERLRDGSPLVVDRLKETTIIDETVLVGANGNKTKVVQTNVGRPQIKIVTSESSMIPHKDKDGSLFPGGDCPNCHDSGPLIDTGPCLTCHKSGPLIDTGPCESCKEPEVVPAPKRRIANYTVAYNPAISIERNCCAMAPLYLEHVDFNLGGRYTQTPYGDKLGNYRFRIFGCRRYDKEAILNHGRVMQKDMNFTRIFEQVTGDCYNLVKMPQDLCLQKTAQPMPEYILTAEITDFYMNVCDAYDWKKAQGKEQRTGSSEIKVKWRLTNLTKSLVLWEGTTTGYSDITLGSADGEIKLVESAFADAASNLQAMPGFEKQLMVRLTPEELTEARQALIDEEIALNPAKCLYQEELNVVKQCEITRPEAEITQCPVENYALLESCVSEDGGVVSGSSCVVVDDTWVDIPVAPKVKEIVVTEEVVNVQPVPETVVISETPVVQDYQEIRAFDSMCIVDRPPYKSLTPENLYKVRASVVEISNGLGKKGTGLVISESFVLTSADLVDKVNNVYKMRTINGKELSGQAVRINPSKNIALIMLEEPTEYTPLSLNLDLPKVNQTGFMTLGVLDVDDFGDGENYLDNNGKIAGYRYSEEKGAEILVDTFVQNMTIGSVLIDGHGTINGVSHVAQKTASGQDLFLPTETALRSVGLSICEKLYDKSSPWEQVIYKPVTEKIMGPAPKAPEAMKAKERK